MEENMKVFKLGFVGVGVMAGAILASILDNSTKLCLDASDIIAYELDKKKLTSYQTKGVFVAESIDEIFQSAKIVFIGVKPQSLSDISKSISSNYSSTIVSILAGVKIDRLRKAFPSLGIVRVMPNMPCKIGLGMSALCFDSVDDKTSSLITAIFNLCGKTIIIDESKFDAVTSISGSGPAYVYSFIDAMIKGGLNGGLSLEESKLLVFQTFKGALALAECGSDNICSLIDSVCSKGGTTIEAITHYEKCGLSNIIIDGISACREKSIILSNNI
jgi:pyrroline-5-carboxylate reductase